MDLKPTCSLVEESRRYNKKAVRSIAYDGSDLVIHFQGEDWIYSRIVFRQPAGFRVLNESDVLEYWNEYSEPNGWLWEVHSGGWLDLEATRSMFNTMGRQLHEYFLADETCVNVLCVAPPEIEDLGSSPDA